jgi:solute carrier family 8 (sodium/calcium exchanger)
MLLGDDDDDDDDSNDKEPKEPSFVNYVLHYISLFWKILFAFVPPTGN